MKHLLASVVALALTAAAGPAPAANCADEDPGGSRVLAARQRVQSQCDCEGAGNHGAYVKCAKDIAKERSSLSPDDADYLPKSCKGAVTRCAAKSTCGKPGFVTCCIEKANGTTKCKTTKSAQKCTDKGGTPGTCTSCCDACSSPLPTGGVIVPLPGPSCPLPVTTTLIPVTTLPDGGTLFE
jgi:hypothetical protein